ncbi:MAG: glucose-1-phosphate thymidylyltransferase RfbA [Bacteriovorax sp.]
MKGIILAGGTGSRLYPMTNIVTKQLQPVYDKPMIYYPLAFLMLGGIKEILIITTPADKASFEKLLGDGAELGIRIEFITQENPTGIPEAFLLGEKFIGNDDVNLILGDNLFYGDMSFYRDAVFKFKNRTSKEEALVFAYSVADPERYGVVEFDRHSHKVLSLEEKPAKPKSSFAIPGLYIFDASVIAKTKVLAPSARGETEIVDLLKNYLNLNKLIVQQITRGVAWLDTGTPKSLLDASNYVAAIEERQGLKIACLEEVALRMDLISKEQFKALVMKKPKSAYRAYLERLEREFDV